MVALSNFNYIIWVSGNIIINSYTHFYCIYVNFSDQTIYMSDCHQSQFEKLKSYVISGRSEQSQDIQYKKNNVRKCVVALGNIPVEAHVGHFDILLFFYSSPPPPHVVTQRKREV